MVCFELQQESFVGLVGTVDFDESSKAHMSWAIAGMGRLSEVNAVGSEGVFFDRHDEPEMPVLAASSCGMNRSSICVELLAESEEGNIGRLTNNLGEDRMGEDESQDGRAKG